MVADSQNDIDVVLAFCVRDRGGMGRKEHKTELGSAAG